MHFFTQSAFSFRNTCSYHHSLFCCCTNVMLSIPNLSQLLACKSEVANLSFTLTPHIHLTEHTHTHAHTRARARESTRLTAPCPGLPGWAGTRKVKPIWILLKQEIVSGNGISWAICKSALRFRQITMPTPHHSVFTGRMPFLPPSQQHQSTEGCHLTEQVNIIYTRAQWSAKTRILSTGKKGVSCLCS